MRARKAQALAARAGAQPRRRACGSSRVPEDRCADADAQMARAAAGDPDRAGHAGGARRRSRHVQRASRARRAARVAPTRSTSRDRASPSRPASASRCSDDAGGDARAAVGDELAARQLGQRLVPGRVDRARDRGPDPVDRVRLAAPPGGRRASTTTSSSSRAASSSASIVSSCALARHELGGLDLLVARAQRAAPAVEVEHGAVVVTEVAQEPPEPLGAAHVPVGDDEDARADPGPRGGRRRRRPPSGSGCRPRRARRGRQVLVDVEERGARECARRGRARARAAGSPSSQRQSTNW